MGKDSHWHFPLLVAAGPCNPQLLPCRVHATMQPLTEHCWAVSWCGSVLGVILMEEPQRSTQSSEEAPKHKRLLSKQNLEVWRVFLPFTVQSHTKIHTGSFPLLWTSTSPTSLLTVLAWGCFYFWMKCLWKVSITMLKRVSSFYSTFFIFQFC